MTNLLASFINAADPTSPLDIAPVAGRIGAEVRGIALSGDLDGGTIAAIRTALSRHKVLFFRDQTELDDTRHEAFAGLLGEPVAHPTVPVADGASGKARSTSGSAMTRLVRTTVPMAPSFSIPLCGCH